MNNTERLFLYTLPRWSGVAVKSTTELLNDMWLRGESAGHHSGVPYDPDGIERLRTELLRDFTGAPSTSAFKPGGPIQTVQDLDDAMQDFQQKPMPKEGAMLGGFLPDEEIRTLGAARHSARSERAKGGPKKIRSKPRKSASKLNPQKKQRQGGAGKKIKPRGRR